MCRLCCQGPVPATQLSGEPPRVHARSGVSPLLGTQLSTVAVVASCHELIAVPLEPQTHVDCLLAVNCPNRGSRQIVN